MSPAVRGITAVSSEKRQNVVRDGEQGNLDIVMPRSVLNRTFLSIATPVFRTVVLPLENTEIARYPKRATATKQWIGDGPVINRDIPSSIQETHTAETKLLSRYEG